MMCNKASNRILINQIVNMKHHKLIKAHICSQLESFTLVKEYFPFSLDSLNHRIWWIYIDLKYHRWCNVIYLYDVFSIILIFNLTVHDAFNLHFHFEKPLSASNEVEFKKILLIDQKACILFSLSAFQFLMLHFEFFIEKQLSFARVFVFNGMRLICTDLSRAVTFFLFIRMV